METKIYMQSRSPGVIANGRMLGTIWMPNSGGLAKSIMDEK